METIKHTLEEQRIAFAKSKFLATPLAGSIMWALVGFASLFLSVRATVWVLFIGTGSIVYLALFISKLTGENFMEKNKAKNEFDSLFFFTVGQAVMVYAIAIPFFLVDYSSLPMTVGILLGGMWIPFSWIIKHWVGIFHAVSRTILVLGLWYALPDHRFTAIPFGIVVIYLITIAVLRTRKVPS